MVRAKSPAELFGAEPAEPLSASDFQPPNEADWKNYLTPRAITKEVAEGYVFRVSGSTAKQLGGFDKFKPENLNGLAFLLMSVGDLAWNPSETCNAIDKGGAIWPLWQLRPDNPPIFDGKPLKYISQARTA